MGHRFWDWRTKGWLLCSPTLSLANEASCHAGAALWRDSNGREPREAFGQQSVKKNWSPQSNSYEWPNPANNFLTEPGKGPTPKPSLNSKMIWAPANALIAALDRSGDRGNKLHLFWFLTHRKCYFKPLRVLGVICSRQEVTQQVYYLHGVLATKSPPL